MTAQETGPLLTDVHSDDDSFSYRQDKVTTYVVFSIIWAILSSFSFGYNIGVINAPEKVIRDCEITNPNAALPECLRMDANVWGLVAGLFALGGLFGALGGGFFCKRWGRKTTILYKNVFLILGAIIMALAVGKEWLFFGCGAATAAAPMYIAEISPVRLRGTFGALHQLAVVIAILVSMLLGLVLSNVPGWRILLGATMVPAIIQIIFAPFISESPRYLVSRNQRERAREALQKIRGILTVDEELETLVVSHEIDSTSSQHINIFELLRKKSFRKPLIIAIVAQIAQQLSGINGVIMFSTSVFDNIIGGGEQKAQLLTVAVGCVNLLVTLLSVYLMDVAGRRVLLLFSEYGMTVLSIAIVIGSLAHIDYLVATCVILFVAVFAIGLGPIPWLLLPEVFPTSAVAPAASLSVGVNWICSGLVGSLFPVIQNTLQGYTFLPFAVISGVAALIMTVLLPETKGKNIEEVTELLK